MMKVAKKIAGWMGIAFFVLMIGVAGFMLITPHFGWQTGKVLSGSMEPALDVGGLIVTRPVNVEEIREGDIICFSLEEKKIVHRVVSIEPDESGKIWFQTKGDANENIDPDLVSPGKDKVDRVALHIPYAGYVAEFMKSKTAFILFIGIPALILIGLLGRDIRRGFLEEKDKRREKTAGLNLINDKGH